MINYSQGQESYWNQEAYALRLRNQAVIQYMPLVVHIAKILWQERNVRRLGTFDDVVSTGYEGLVRAANLYNPNHPSKASFKTYAYQSLLRWILRAADDTGLIRVPASAVRQVHGGKKPGQPLPSKELVEKVLIALRCHQLPGGYDRSYEPDYSRDFFSHEIATIVQGLPKAYADIISETFGTGGRDQHTVRQVAERNHQTCQAVRHRRKLALNQLSDHLMASGVDESTAEGL